MTLFLFGQLTGAAADGAPPGSGLLQPTGEQGFQAVAMAFGLLLLLLAGTLTLRARRIAQINAELARRIQERTNELSRINESLHTEIQERRQAEESLRISEEKYRLLFESANDAILLNDAVTGKIISANPRAAELLGWPVDELVGREQAGFHPPEDTARFAALIEVAQSQGKYLVTDMNVVHRDGPRVPVDINANMIRLRDRAVVVSIIRDVTERQLALESLCESEKRFRALIHHSSDILTIHDRRGGFLYASPSLQRLLGYPPEVTGERSLLDLVHPEDKAAMESLFATLQPGGAPSAALEYRLRHAQGHWLVIESVATALAEGDLQGILLNSRDITERKQAETARVQLESKLRQAQKMEAIGTLAGGIAHDFNNILAAIIPYTHLAKEDAGTNPAVQESLDQVLVAAERAKVLVNQILAFSRQQERERQPCRLQPILKEGVKLMRAALPATVEIDAHIDESAPQVVADPTQMHQVLVNLCTNASQAMAESTGRLAIRYGPIQVDETQAATHPDLKPGLHVRLAVSDTGHGMTEETLKRIFDPFFTTRKPGGGSGLGLSVVDGIVRDHGGAILVQSEPKAGTTVQIFLPALMPSPGPATPTARLPAGRGQHILLVDDERPVASVTSIALTRLGYRVSMCLDPREALDQFRAGPEQFDLLLTDMSMPHMSGVELTRAVLAIRPDLPVILATGFSGTWTPESARQAGVREIVYKPLSPEGYAQVLKRALHTDGV